MLKETLFDISTEDTFILQKEYLGIHNDLMLIESRHHQTTLNT